MFLVALVWNELSFMLMWSKGQREQVVIQMAQILTVLTEF